MCSASFSLAFAQVARPVQAVAASELDSWLLPSAKGVVPDAHECRRRHRTPEVGE